MGNEKQNSYNKVEKMKGRAKSGGIVRRYYILTIIPGQSVKRKRRHGLWIKSEDERVRSKEGTRENPKWVSPQDKGRVGGGKTLSVSTFVN